MSWEPATIPQVAQAALNVARDAIIDLGSNPDADPPVVGPPPDHIWIDMRPPPRKPELVCDNGALAAWLGASRPASTDCAAPTDWPIRLRWWICFPSLTDTGTVPTADRQAVSVRIHETAQAVQRALIAWACQTRYDAIISLTIGESRPVDPAGGSAGWEWLVTART